MPSPTAFWHLAWTPGVRLRALKVAALVGTVLALINHLDALTEGTFNLTNLLQVLLTYAVPYAVSTYSSVRALQAP